MVDSNPIRHGPYKKGKYGLRDMHRRKQMCKERENMATYKPRRETRGRFFSQGPQKEQAL